MTTCIKYCQSYDIVIVDQEFFCEVNAYLTGNTHLEGNKPTIVCLKLCVACLEQHGYEASSKSEQFFADNSSGIHFNFTLCEMIPNPNFTAMHACCLYTRYPMLSSRAWPSGCIGRVRARAKVSCIQACCGRF